MIAGEITNAIRGGNLTKELVMRGYEHRNRFITPIVHGGLSWLLGWPYRGSETDRRRLVRQLPLIAFSPQTASRPATHST